MPSARNAITATAPTTMPPIAPPDIEADEPWVDVEEGAVDVSLEPLGVVDGDELEVEVVLEDVCVAAINVAGSKVQELADGEAALKDEYVLLSTGVLILTRVSWAEFQQMLIWPGSPVQISLFIHHQYATSSPVLKGEQTFCLDSTTRLAHSHS
jgi:hypothetical protein